MRKHNHKTKIKIRHILKHVKQSMKMCDQPVFVLMDCGTVTIHDQLSKTEKLFYDRTITLPESFLINRRENDGDGIFFYNGPRTPSAVE